MPKRHIYFYTKYWNNGIDWYANQFKNKKVNMRAKSIIGDHTPNELSFYKKHDTLKRMKDTFPDLKIIVSLRNPVDRAVSAAVHHKLVDGTGGNKPNINEYFVKDGKYLEPSDGISIITERCIYWKSIKELYNTFDEEQFKIVILEDIAKDPKKVLDDICEFLGASKTIKPDKRKFNQRKKNIDIKPETRKIMLEYFKPHNDKLFKIINRNIEEWDY